MSKKEVTKEKVTKEKKVSNNSKLKTKKEKREPFIIGVKNEIKKVRWPLKKEMVKYSVATLSFIIFFALFFALSDLIIAGLKMLVG